MPKCKTKHWGNKKCNPRTKINKEVRIGNFPSDIPKLNIECWAKNAHDYINTNWLQDLPQYWQDGGFIAIYKM